MIAYSIVSIGDHSVGSVFSITGSRVGPAKKPPSVLKKNCY